LSRGPRRQLPSPRNGWIRGYLLRVDLELRLSCELHFSQSSDAGPLHRGCPGSVSRRMCLVRSLLALWTVDRARRSIGRALAFTHISRRARLDEADLGQTGVSRLGRSLE